MQQCLQDRVAGCWILLRVLLDADSQHMLIEQLRPDHGKLSSRMDGILQII